MLAAHRAGVRTLILPKDNEKDLADIPKNVLDVMSVYLVQNMDEVLKIGADRAAARADRAGGRGRGRGRPR